MTVKLVVLYTEPEDRAAFDAHYLGSHMPLADSIPGLQRAETAVFAAAIDGNELPFYRVTEMYFADQDALEAGFASDAGKAAAEDFGRIAPPGSRLLVAAVED